MARTIIEYGLDFDGCGALLAYISPEEFLNTWAYNLSYVNGNTQASWRRILNSSGDTVRAHSYARVELARFLQARIEEPNTSVCISSASNRVNETIDRQLMPQYGMKETSQELFTKMAHRLGIRLVPSRYGDYHTSKSAPGTIHLKLPAHDVNIDVNLDNFKETMRINGVTYSYQALLKVALVQERIQALHMLNPDGNNEYYFIDDRIEEFGRALADLLVIPPSVKVHLTEFDQYLAYQEGLKYEKDTAPTDLVKPRHVKTLKHITLEQFERAHNGLYDRQSSVPIIGWLRSSKMAERLKRSTGDQAIDVQSTQQVFQYARENPSSRTAKVLTELRRARRPG